MTLDELDVSVIRLLSSPTESVTNISKINAPSVSDSNISYCAKYFSDPSSLINIDWPTMLDV